MQAGYLNIGLTGTDMSGSYYLPRIVGYARAAEALMTARRIGAEELKEWGFANKVVADEDVVEEAVKMAEAMVKNLLLWVFALPRNPCRFPSTTLSSLTLDQDGEP